MSAAHQEALSHASSVLWREYGTSAPRRGLEAAIEAYLLKMRTPRPEAPAPKKMAMTPRQKELLDFIKLYCTEQGGISPSYDEMKDFMGFASKSGIHRLICGLEERGLIRRIENHARTIVVIGESE